MKLGFNLLLWTPHVTAEHEPLLRSLKKTGYDGVELPLFEGDPVAQCLVRHMDRTRGKAPPDWDGAFTPRPPE